MTTNETIIVTRDIAALEVNIRLSALPGGLAVYSGESLIAFASWEQIAAARRELPLDTKREKS